jgi:hypothetical protein
MRAVFVPPSLVRRGRRPAVACAAAVAVLAVAGAAPAGASTGLVAPSLDATTDNATTTIDPDLVLPTDTEVEAPAPDFVARDGFNRYGQGSYRVNGPNVLWGSLVWAETATGPASGVRVTMVREQDGWRFSTTTDQLGRFRVAVPDGTYALMATDARLANGTWTDPDMRGPYVVEGIETWNGGRGVGIAGAGVVPRPQYSCRSQVGKIVTGTDGWAPGADPETTSCPYPNRGNGLDGTASVMAWGSWFESYAETGRDGVRLSYQVPPVLPATPAKNTPAPASPVIGVPQLPRTIRLDRRGARSVVVRCLAGTTCAGTVSLTTPVRTRARSTTRPATLASGRLAPGRTRVAFHVTTAGKRLPRRRDTTVDVTWQPTGGTAATTATARLRLP